MKSIASAPGKVILFGEHFVVYGTKAILCSINKRITTTSQFLDKKIVKIKSDLGEKEIDIDSLANLDEVFPEFLRPLFHIAYDALEENSKNKGIEITLESEIPYGVGLGSSSAACVSATASVNGLFRKLTKETILKKAIEAERIIFKQTSGADSAVSVFGGLMTFDTKIGYEKLSIRNNLNLVIANSLQIHNTQEIVKQVKNFKEINKELFEKLTIKEEEIVKNAIVAIEKNDLKKLGVLMLENQYLLEQIGVSTEKLDILISEAKKSSYGAKITGAGGGGCIISLVDENNSKETISHLGKISNSFMAKIDYTGITYL